MYSYVCVCLCVTGPHPSHQPHRELHHQLPQTRVRLHRLSQG